MSWIKKSQCTIKKPNDQVDFFRQPHTTTHRAYQEFASMNPHIQQQQPWLPINATSLKKQDFLYKGLPPQLPQRQYYQEEWPSMDIQQQEWQFGYDAWFANEWKDPDECDFENQRQHRPRFDMQTPSFFYMQGIKAAETQWRNTQMAIDRARASHIQIPPSLCHYCQHTTSNHTNNSAVTNACMDIKFRMSTLTEKLKQTSVSRPWFHSKTTWTQKPTTTSVVVAQKLPRDILDFGRLVLRDGCGFLFEIYPKYACTFDSNDSTAPPLSRENFRTSTRVIQVPKNTTPVVDDHLNATVLCSQCAFKMDIHQKPVLFDKTHMRYVDDESQNEEDNSKIEECFLVKDAILVENRVMHSNCEPSKLKMDAQNAKKHTTQLPDIKKQNTTQMPDMKKQNTTDTNKRTLVAQEPISRKKQIIVTTLTTHRSNSICVY